MTFKARALEPAIEDLFLRLAAIVSAAVSLVRRGSLIPKPVSYFIWDRMLAMIGVYCRLES